MTLFAIDEIQLIILAIFVLVGLLNKIFSSQQKRAGRAPAPGPEPKGAEPPRAMPDQDDIDQFLGEILGREQARPGPEELVVPAPSPSPSPAPRQAAPARSGQQRSREASTSTVQARQQPTERHPERLVQPGRSVTDLAEQAVENAGDAAGRKWTDSASQAVRRAGDAAMAAGQLEHDESGGGPAQAQFSPDSLVGSLRSSEDLRRAIVLVEILRPARSRRRR